MLKRATCRHDRSRRPFRFGGRLRGRHRLGGGGWNPGLDDLAAFHATDPEGFLIGRRHGEPVFETARMYRGPDPKLPLERIYGVTKFELG